MPGKTRRLHRLLLGFAVVTVCAGCTSARRGVQRIAASHLADTATSYNLAIEQTQDEMLLLNVIRAQDNYPLYVTDASKVTGTVKADLTLGLKIPLVHAGGANANDYFAMPTAEYSSSPSMDVNLLNTKSFMAGFLTPIPAEMFAYYWDQGWSAEFLLYLFVLRVDVDLGKEAKPQPETLHNYPDSDAATQSDLQGFSEWVHTMVANGRPRLCGTGANETAIGPPLDTKELEALKFLLPDAKEDFTLSLAAATPRRWQLWQRNRTLFLMAGGLDCQGKPLTGTSGATSPEDESGEHASHKDQGEPPKSQKDRIGAQEPRPFARETVRAKAGGGIEYDLTLRSPEGVLYYLGELARLENRKQRVLLIHVCDYKSSCATHQKDEKPPLAPLFVALDRQKHRECPIIIWVRSLDGHDYMIPNGEETLLSASDSASALQLADAARLCAPGETMHALELLSQLIGLQKSAKDFTTTSTVKVVGQ